MARVRAWRDACTYRVHWQSHGFAGPRPAPEGLVGVLLFLSVEFTFLFLSHEAPLTRHGTATIPFVGIYATQVRR